MGRSGNGRRRRGRDRHVRGSEANLGGLRADLRLAHLEAGEADIAFEELAGAGRRQREHVVVPRFELLEPAARADFGLQRADLLARRDDPAIETGDVGALGGDLQREHVAAEGCAADRGHPSDRLESAGHHRDDPSFA